MKARKITDKNIKIAYERYNKIVDERGILKAMKEVSSVYGVSSRTLRRYFDKLENDNLKPVDRKSTSYLKDKKKGGAIRRAWDYYQQGNDLMECVKVFGISKSTLHRYFVDFNGGKLGDRRPKETIKSITETTHNIIKTSKISKRQQMEVDEWLNNLKPEDLKDLMKVDERKENNETIYGTGQFGDIADMYDLAEDDERLATNAIWDYTNY